MKQLFIVSLILLALILAPTLTHDLFAKQSKADKKAEKKIERALEKYVKDHYDKYCLVGVIVKGNNETHTVYDKGCVIVPPPPPPSPTNLPPVAKIEVSKLIANVSDFIQLSGNQSTDSDGTIVSYNWTGANFTNSNTTDTQFTFPNETQVTVSLTVTDNNGSKASAGVQIVQWIPAPPPSTECKLGEVKDPVTGECIIPAPSQNTTIDFTGDVSGTTVLDQLMKNDADIVVVSGDLGYKSTLSWFKDNYGDSLGEQLRCLVGNHEATEDGSAALEKETLQFCGEHWYVKTANSTTLLIGFNSNGDDKSEISYIKSITSDSVIMEGVKNVILMSHKNGHVPPSSHHPAEVDNVYSAVNDISGIRVIEVNAHNHVMASAPSEDWFISGAGGKSHYSCGTDSTWTFCNNKVYGYLEFVINNADGSLVANFYDTSGKAIR